MREIKFRAWDGDTSLGYKQHGYVKRKVEWHPNADKRGYVMDKSETIAGWGDRDLETVGNIYESPELLEASR